jgi:hypothetical protein
MNHKPESLRRPDRRYDPLCHVCDERLAPVIFCRTAKRADDMHLSCDVCLDPCCAECCDIDGEGLVMCLDCIQQKMVNEEKVNELP